MINIQIFADDEGLTSLAIEINNNRKLLLKPGYPDEDGLHLPVSGFAPENSIEIWLVNSTFNDESENSRNKEF
jgi:hypothetical protein